MRFRKVIQAAVLTVAATSSTLAQADTLSPRPLFTRNDAYLAAIFVGTTVAMTSFDKSYAMRLQRPANQDNKFYGNMARAVETFVEPGSYVIGGSLYLFGRLANKPRIADLGWHGTEALIVGSLITTVGKGIIGRSRPYNEPNADGTPNPSNYRLMSGFGDKDRRSFPSGHTTAAFAAAAAVSSEATRWWPQYRWPIGVLMYGGALSMGLSRMYENKHWASDVALGAMIGTFAGNKVVRYHHSNPGTGLDKWILGATILPDGNGGSMLGLRVMPGPGFFKRR